MSLRRRRIVATVCVAIVVAALLYRGATTRAFDGGINYGWTYEDYPRCDPAPRVRAEELRSRFLSCDLEGATILVIGTSIEVPGRAGSRVEFFDEGSLGVMNIGGKYGAVVFTSDQVWGRPAGVKLAKKAGVQEGLKPWSDTRSENRHVR